MLTYDKNSTVEKAKKYNTNEEKLQKIYNSKDDHITEIGITAMHEMGHNVLKEDCHTNDYCFGREIKEGENRTVNIMMGGDERPKTRFPFQQSPESFAFLPADKAKMQSFFSKNIKIKDNFTGKFNEKYKKK